MKKAAGRCAHSLGCCQLTMPRVDEGAEPQPSPQTTDGKFPAVKQRGETGTPLRKDGNIHFETWQLS